MIKEKNLKINIWNVKALKFLGMKLGQLKFKRWDEKQEPDSKFFHNSSYEKKKKFTHQVTDQIPLQSQQF